MFGADLFDAFLGMLFGGVIHQNIEFAKFINRLLYGLLTEVFIANIARDRHRKTYVGSELSKCKDFGEIAFRRPVEKGYIVNWEAQREIWDRELLDKKTALQPCDPTETRLILTEQPGAMPVLQANCDQMVFEEFGFASYYRGIGLSCSPPCFFLALSPILRVPALTP